jgi:glycosyltransferase involved in cell wall biosynthesis
MTVSPVGEPMRRVLWLTFHYPPLASVGTHRNLGLTRWLPEHGWLPTVLTIHPRAGLATDPDLLARVPAQIRVHRVAAPHLFEELARWRGRDPSGEPPPGAAPAGMGQRSLVGQVKNLVTWPLHVPDIEWPWRWNAVRRGRALLREERPDCIVASSPPATTLLAAARLSAWSGIPWVADLRDPWAGNPFTTSPYAWLERRNERLESRTLRSAACIVANTTRAAAELATRYPALAERIATVPNGFDPEMALVASAKAPAGPADTITLVHAGSLYGRRRLDTLLRVLASEPDARPLLRVTLLGAGSDALAAQVRALGIGDRIELRPPVAHREALAETRATDVVLIAGVAGLTPESQVPAKLFEALALGKAVLALSKQGGAIQETLDSAGATYWRADPESETEIRSALAAIRAARRDGRDFASMRARQLDAFALPNLARRFAEVLARAASGGAQARRSPG